MIPQCVAGLAKPARFIARLRAVWCWCAWLCLWATAAFAQCHFDSWTTDLVNRNTRSAELVKQKPSLSDLTPTERRILKLIAEKKTSKKIAAELFIGHRTVENHRANICQKLDLKGSHSLIKFALDHKSQLS